MYFLYSFLLINLIYYHNKWLISEGHDLEALMLSQNHRPYQDTSAILQVTSLLNMSLVYISWLQFVISSFIPVCAFHASNNHGSPAGFQFKKTPFGHPIPLSSAWIKDTAFSDWGLIEHLNGLGWLLWSDIREVTPGRRISAHLIVPEVFSWTGSMTSTIFFGMSKMANGIAHKMKSEASASWMPGNNSKKRINFCGKPQSRQ